MRNIEKNIEKGRAIIQNSHRQGMTVTELLYFMDSLESLAEKRGLKEAMFRTIGDVFEMGVAVGYGIANKQQKKSEI